MTADETPIPAAYTPRTRAQVAAIHGYNAIETDRDGFDLRHARVAEAALTPDSDHLPDEHGGAQ